MKKLFLSLSLMLLLCGCSVNYNLEISQNDFLEETTIMTDVTKNEIYEGEALSNILDKTKRDYFEPIYYENNDFSIPSRSKYYEITNYQNANWQGIVASNKFDRTSFYRSGIVKKCYRELDYQNDGNYVMFRTSNNCEAFNSYPLLEEITINIKTDLKVIVTNADKVENNIYTWVINQDNYQNKPIRITYTLNNNLIKDENEENETEEEKEEQNKENKKQNNYNKIILVIGFILLIGILTIVIVRKNKRF